jgi:4-hydroxybenzoate polyprenyltransferase
MAEAAQSPYASGQRVIAVDLDGTLVLTDMLLENLFLFLRLHPLRLFSLFAWILGGKAHFKRMLANAVLPNVECLPYSQPLIDWLRAQKEAGAMLVLATASDLRIARKVADHVGIFDIVLGTEKTNLASVAKRDALSERYGSKGFEYVGNSSADYAVWRDAGVVHVANPERGVLRKAKDIAACGVMGMVFDSRPRYGKSLIRSLRLHQWAKNLLLFVPLMASHRFTEVSLVMAGVLAFIAFGACASSVYLLNDLLDLNDDRQHRTKRNRPLASGELPILHAVLLTPLLLVLAFGLALALLPQVFAMVLAGYYVLTLSYSLVLKRLVMIDVVMLALLYTVRVIAGAAAMTLVTTFWILAFCMFIFLSLAFIKRYTELYDARESGLNKTVGRGYLASDFELLASLGGASGYISVLVLALYINDASAQRLYQSPQWMWLACPLLLFWMSRVWLLAHRGQMHDDPIVFALRDAASLWIGVAFVAVFAMASF